MNWSPLCSITDGLMISCDRLQMMGLHDVSVVGAVASQRNGSRPGRGHSVMVEFLCSPASLASPHSAKTCTLNYPPTRLEKSFVTQLCHTCLFFLPYLSDSCLLLFFVNLLTSTIHLLYPWQWQLLLNTLLSLWSEKQPLWADGATSPAGWAQWEAHTVTLSL